MAEVKKHRAPKARSAAAGTATTWTGLLGVGLPILYPDIDPRIPGFLVGLAIACSQFVGSVASDAVHDAETADPVQETSLILRQIAKRLG